jgi:APA family basic amino acid/polyamine antiporter
VLVALFGQERSPETLVELGAALAGDGGLEVVHITEVPEQTTAEAVSEEDDKVASVRRRVLAMRDRENIPLQFDAILSRDVVETVHELTSRLHCEWMIKEFRGKSETSFTVINPLGWLKDHLPSNLATFDDAGVRYIRRILVHTEPGSHDLLVARTADHLGRINDAEVTFSHFVHKDASAERVTQAEQYLDEVRKLCVRPSERLVVRGKRLEEAIGHVSAGFDLLITAESPEKNLVERLTGSAPNRITEKAACSVLRLQSPGRPGPHRT